MFGDPRSRLQESESDVFQAPSFVCFTPEPTIRRITANLAVCLSASPQWAPQWAFAPMLRSAYLPKQFSFGPLLASAIFHVAGIAFLINLPDLPADQIRTAAVVELPRAERKII